MRKLILVPLIMICITSCSQTNDKKTVNSLKIPNIKEYENAILLYDSLINLYPDSSIFYSSRGGAYYWIEDFEKALLDCNHALKLDKLNFAAYYNRGLIYLNTGRYNLALSDFNNAIKINPFYAEAYSFRGNTFGNLGDYKQALKDLNKSVEINPNVGMTFYNRGVIHGYLGDTSSELSDYNKAIELDKTLDCAYYNRGLIKGRELNDIEGAINDFSFALEINPEHIKSLLNRGFARLLNDEYDLAIKDYEKVLTIDKNNTKAKEKLQEINEIMKQN